MGSRKDTLPNIISIEDRAYLYTAAAAAVCCCGCVAALLGVSCLQVELHGSTLPWQNVCPSGALSSLASLRYSALGGMVDTKSTMGAREHWQAAAGRGSEAAVLKSAPNAVVALPHARSLLLPEVVNSPTDSEGTVYFEAHEEIPWTPDRPSRRSPASIAARRMQLAVWSQQQGDNPIMVAPKSKDVAPLLIPQQPRDPKAGDDGLEEEAMERKGQATADIEHEVGALTICACCTERDRQYTGTYFVFSFFPVPKRRLLYIYIDRSSSRLVTLTPHSKVDAYSTALVVILAAKFPRTVLSVPVFSPPPALLPGYGTGPVIVVVYLVLEY